MRNYYLIWRGYKNTNICSFHTLHALKTVLNKLIYLYDKDLEFQIVYGREIYLNGGYYD